MCIADALSNPSELSACVIGFCSSKRMSCTATFSVEFYDQFAKGTPIIPIVMGLGPGDLVLVLILFIEIVAMCAVCCGTYAKYGGIAKKKQKAMAKRLKKGKK